MSKESWGKEWNKYYGVYNKRHEAIWKKLSGFIGDNLADLGCGPALIYQGKRVNLTGVDYSSEAIREAKKNYPPGKYLVEDITHTSLPDNYFDTVILLGVLDCFEDWTAVLKESRRIKKDNGVIFATLLDGYKGHKWKDKCPHITSNWYLYTEQ